MKKRISVVTPCFNEEKNVALVHEKVKAIFDALPQYDYEHIFIDNASTDGTVAILKALAEKHPYLKVIVNARNFGWIRSPYYGLIQAEGDAVILMVSDLQEPPELIPQFISKWEEGYKIVLGAKNSSHQFFLTFLFNHFYYTIINGLSDVDLIKHFTGFGLYDLQVIKILRGINNPYPYLRGLISEIGFEKALVHYKQPPRKFGFSKSNFFRLYDLAMLGFTSHTKVPLRLATMSGFALSVVMFVIGIFYLVLKLLFWDWFQMGMAPLVIGMFLLGAIQLFFIGLLGEYILSININVRNFPLVIEKERVNFVAEGEAVHA